MYTQCAKLHLAHLVRCTGHQTPLYVTKVEGIFFSVRLSFSVSFHGALFVSRVFLVHTGGIYQPELLPTSIGGHELAFRRPLVGQSFLFDTIAFFGLKEDAQLADLEVPCIALFLVVHCNHPLI
eukprot:SAG31_NODE_1164_length_9581_cov_16.106623_3_plen_124_part_00